MSLQKEKGSVKNLPQHNAVADIWVSDYLTPSWVCLPTDQPVLAIIQPGETALDALETICKVRAWGIHQEGAPSGVEELHAPETIAASGQKDGEVLVIHSLFPIFSRWHRSPSLFTLPRIILLVYRMIL